MDERHTLAAARYIERNPVRANMVARAEDYPWSSARAHLLGRDDGLVKTAPLLALAGDWSTLLHAGPDPVDPDQFRRHAATGRPLGSDGLVDGLERQLGRILRPRKPGPRSGDTIRNPACRILRSS